jgi:L-seryl-tRNA(Ser) seleniumtransferase
MTITSLWNRRTFLGSAGVLAGVLLNARKMFGLPAASIPAAGRPEKLTGLGATGNVYEELGVTTVINGEGTMTVLGGSLPRPEVEAVMALASQYFVAVVDLERAAGRRIVELLKLPADYDAIVTCGAAAGMQSGLSGILTGDNRKFIEQLPDLTGMKSEVIIQKSHRNPFDHQLRATGVKLIVVETREDVKKALNPQTAMMHFSNFANAAGQIKVDEWVKLAHEYQIPAFIDAAADTPPVSHLWDYANMGYDLIAFSGGKAIRGPQCAGLLIGKKEFVANALLNNSPHEDTLGRSQKVGKEEIVGMVKALESYLKEDHAALDKEWSSRLDYVSAEISRVPGVTTSFNVPDIANHVPHMAISWDSARISLSPQEASRMLRKGNPSIALDSSDQGLAMNSFMLKPGEERIIARQLIQLFKSHSA